MTHCERLPNGAQVALAPHDDLGTVALGVWVRCGARHDPPELLGLSHYLEHMVFKRAGGRGAAELAQAIEILGGQLDAYTTHEATCYLFQVLPERFAEAAELLAALTVRAELDATDIETERQVIAEEIQEAEDTPGDVAGELVAARAWGDHPLARPVLGTVETTARIDREILLDWNRTGYSGPRMLLAAAGRLEPERAAEELAKQFADVGDTLPPADSPPSFRPGPVSRRLPVDQIHVCLAAPGLPAGDPCRYALALLNAILGGCMSSRLFQEVRERRGLAYHVQSTHQATSDAGLLLIEAITSPGSVAELLRVVRGELGRLASDGVTDAEMGWVMEYARATLTLAAETATARVGQLARGMFYSGRPRTLADRLAALTAVDRAAVSDLAAELLVDRHYALATVGAVTERRTSRWWEVMTG